MLSIHELEQIREERGLSIAKNREAQISRVDLLTYKVLSQSGSGAYLVTQTECGWTCECPDFMYRNLKCKHIWAIEISLTLKYQVRKNVIIDEVSVSKCLFCSSENLKKFGVRHNKDGDLQRFLCGSCGRTFSVNIGFEKMKHNPRAITSAMQLYFGGESLRNTQKSLRLLGVDVSHKTIYLWIKKYITLMQNYVETLKPNVSDIWRADELYVKVKGDMKYVFALLDDETRFWIAQEVADTKERHDASKLFRKAEKLIGRKPRFLITDGLPSYHDAYCKEYWQLGKPKTEHIRHITLRGDRNNNKMERFNGEVRDREKTMRGLKKKDTPILRGYQVFHNYIREHEALSGQTPAEACGIMINGRNKWVTLIQNSVHQPKGNNGRKILDQPKR